MKLHEMHAHPTRKTHFHEKLGIKDTLKNLLFRSLGGSGSGEGQMLPSRSGTMQAANVQMGMTEARQSEDFNNSARLE